MTKFKSQVVPNGGQKLDFTAIACGAFPPCNNPPAPPAVCCELSVEKGNQQCADTLFGAVWWTPDPNVQLDDLPVGQAAGGSTHKISEGDGYVSICGSIAMGLKPGACIRLHVKKGSPACDLNPSGGCILQ